MDRLLALDIFKFVEETTCYKLSIIFAISHFILCILCTDLSFIMYVL